MQEPVRELDAMGEDGLLAFAGDCAETARRAEVDLLRAAYQWAVLHAPERLDPVESAKPGREQARQWGGPGTPQVTEFAAAALGARIGRSPWAARQLIADALDLHHRHPQLWARVQAGEVRASYARHVVAKTRDLQPDEAAHVDAGVVESADGRIPWTRFETLVAAKVAQAAPDLAREKEDRARTATFARKLRTDAHGMGSFLVRGDIAKINALEAAVTTYATQLAGPFPDLTDDERRVLAVFLLVCGRAQAPLPSSEAHTEVPAPDPLVDVVLYVHSYAGPDREEIARVEGHGPVTETWLRDVLGPRARFTVQPALDLAGQAPVDAYEIPDRHRTAVHLMTPADVFPYASNTSRRMQIDHTVPHDDGGPSTIGNYGPMTLTHHRIKTHDRWQVQQPFPGIYLWRDPGGAIYLVDHTGTRQIPHAHDNPEQQPPPPQRPPLVVEMWRPPFDIDLDLDAA
ncbi:MAG: HNH endonuclease [Nocardioides sp.]|nr:HNH endonuclease [Nocardioides sp.]